MFFLLLSYNSRTILVQILISPRFSIHWCPRIGLFEFLEGYVHCYSEKPTVSKVSANFSAKHQRSDPF